MEPNAKANRGVSMESLAWNMKKMDSFCAIMVGVFHLSMNTEKFL